MKLPDSMPTPQEERALGGFVDSHPPGCKAETTSIDIEAIEQDREDFYLRSTNTGGRTSDGRSILDKARGLFGKAQEFTDTVKSSVEEGNVSLEVLDFRHQCCTGETLAGVKVSEPCPGLTVNKKGHKFCNECQCPKSRLARIDPIHKARPWTSKLKYPRVRCPYGRFSFMPGVRA